MRQSGSSQSSINVEYTKLKRSFHRQFRRTPKHNDAKHIQWRVVVQREVDKLYRSLVEMHQSKLINKDGENPEEAIFGVLCLLGDCVLADKWLSQWSKHIRFDFKLTNYCERIEEWLVDLSNRGQPADLISIQPATCQALATCLLERVFAERLEHCTVMHLAAMSGDNNMVIAVQTIWDEIIHNMVSQIPHRGDDDLHKRIDDLEREWRCYNSLGETPYNLVPECSVVGNKKRCYCSASFNDVPCTARSARRGLLASAEASAPLFFSGVFAIIVVAIIVGVVSFHSQSNAHSPEHFTAAEWGGIAFSYLLLWGVLAVSSFIKHLWNILTLGLVLLEVQRAPPSQRPPPTAPQVAEIKKRRLAVRIEKVLAVVLGTDSPSDSDLNMLERALNDSRVDMGRQQKPEYILDEEAIKRAHDLLLSRREARRRVKEFAHMRKVAGKILANLGELEVEFRTRVDTHLSMQLQNAAQVELRRSEQFIKDPRMKDEEDVMRVALKHARVKELLKLRLRLEEVLGDPRDEVFEHVVMRCREARIQESRMVKERLLAIEQPRNMSAQLKAAIMAKKLDSGELQRALSAVSSCPLRQDLVSLSEKAKVLRNALKILEQAQTNGRKAHAQLLVSSDHDISHIDRLASELAVFEQNCRDIRGEQTLPANVHEVQELLQKWKREQGPSRRLKAAVGGTDCDELREAIAQAKEAGIGIKAARKRLSALEHKEKVKQQLAAALKRKDVNLLREAVATARQAGINVDDEKEVLKKLAQKEACREKLALARQSNREDKLKAAVASARELDIDCAAAQQQLEALMEQRLTETLLKEEARANQRQQCLAELDNLLEDPECDTTKLVDTMRVAKVVGLDIAHAVKILTERMSRELHHAMNPIDNDNDPKVLSDAIRCASLVSGFGASIDTTQAKEKLDEWYKQERISKQLSTSIETVENCADARTMASLEEAIASAAPTLGEESELFQRAQNVLQRANAMMDLGAAERTCRVAHEQACMMHRRLDKIEKAVPEYINAFVTAMDKADGKVADGTLSEMREQVEQWKEEAKLIYDLRTAVEARDMTALSKAIQIAQDKCKAINVEAAKRMLEKLNKEAENDSLRAQIEEALSQENHDCAMLSAAIDAAKAAGLPTYDATVVLVKWTNEGRNVLSKARASRNKDKLREALEGTAAMGLGGLPEWTEAKRALEGGNNREGRTSGKSASNTKSDGKGDHKNDSVEMGPRHPRWKTEICSHWLMHGTCSYGKDRCNFAHGEDDLRKLSDNAEAETLHRNKEIAKSKPPPKSPARPAKPVNSAQVWNNYAKSNKSSTTNISHSPDTSDTQSQDSYSSKPSDAGKLWSSVAQKHAGSETLELSMLQGSSVDDVLMGNMSERENLSTSSSVPTDPTRLKEFQPSRPHGGSSAPSGSFSTQEWLMQATGSSWESTLHKPSDTSITNQPVFNQYADASVQLEQQPTLSAAQEAQQQYLQQRRDELEQQQQLHASRGIRPSASPFSPRKGVHGFVPEGSSRLTAVGSFAQPGAAVPWGGDEPGRMDWSAQHGPTADMPGQYVAYSPNDQWNSMGASIALGQPIADQWTQVDSDTTSFGVANFESVPPPARPVHSLGQGRTGGDEADFESVDGDKFYDAVVEEPGAQKNDIQDSELLGSVLGNIMDDDFQANTLRSVLDFMD